MFKFLEQNRRAIGFSVFQTVHTFGLQIIVPFFSIILLELNWNNQEIAYFFSAFMFSIFIFGSIIGKISDIIGRKKIILFGLLTQTLFFSTFLFIDSKLIVYALRLLDGFGFACISIVTMSAFEDTIKEKRGFWTGLYLSLGTIGSIIAPIIAGYIADKHSNQMLLALSIFFTVISTIILILIPEKHNKIKHKITLKDINPLSEFKEFVKYERLRGMALLGIIMNSKGQIYNIFFPILVITTLNLPKSYLGFFIAIPAFFHVFQFYYGKLADLISARFGTILGATIVGTSIFFLPYVNSIPSLIVLLVMYGIGGGIWNVNAWTLMSKVAKKHDIEGEIIGTYTSISKLGMFFATLIGATLIDTFGITKTLQYFAIAIIITNIIVHQLYFKPVLKLPKPKNYFHKFIEQEKVLAQELEDK